MSFHSPNLTGPEHPNPSSSEKLRGHKSSEFVHNGKSACTGEGCAINLKGVNKTAKTAKTTHNLKKEIKFISFNMTESSLLAIKACNGSLCANRFFVIKHSQCLILAPRAKPYKDLITSSTSFFASDNNIIVLSS